MVKDLTDEFDSVIDGEIGDVVLVDSEAPVNSGSFLIRKDFAGWLEVAKVYECENNHIVKKEDLYVGQYFGQYYMLCPICASDRFRNVGSDEHFHNIRLTSLQDEDIKTKEEILEESGYGDENE